MIIGKDDVAALKPQHKRKTQNKLSALNETFSLEGCNIAVYLIGQDGIILSANSHACEIFGYPDNGITGLDMRSLCVDPSYWDSLEADLYQSGGHGQYRLRLRKRDGSQMVCSCTLAIELGVDEFSDCYICMIRDITGM